MRFHVAVLWAAGLCWLTLPALAQVQVGRFDAMMTGQLGLAYDGSVSDPGQSSHGTSLTGNGILNGYFYDPSFLSFRVQPSYGRTQDNADSQSIFDTGSVSASAAIFKGGHFPGNIEFGKSYDSTGQFGLPGVTGLVTKNNSQSFTVNWSEHLPGLPSLSLGFTAASGASSLVGSSEESHSSSRQYSLNVTHSLLGFSLSGDAAHQSAKVDSFLLTGTNDGSDASSNSYGVGVGHKLPLHGYFFTRYGRSDYSSTISSEESTYNGTSDNINSTLGFSLKVPITISANYTDNAYASIEQVLLSQGNSMLLTTTTPKSSQLALSASSQYLLLHTVNISGYVNHLEQNTGGTTYSTTQGGGTLGYGFARLLKGLVINIGMVDTANQDGNQHAAVIGNVSYGHSLGHWRFGASYGYDQDTETLGIVYTTSTMNYTASIGRRFENNIKWSASVTGTHTGFEQQVGSSARSTTYYTSLIARWISASGTYSQSSGNSILTQSGIMTQPLPMPVSGILTTYSARSYGGGVGMSPVRKLTITGSYSRSKSLTESPSLSSSNLSDVAYARVAYQFRKMSVGGGYSRIRQIISSSGAIPSSTSSYYIGLLRWFNFF